MTYHKRASSSKTPAESESAGRIQAPAVRDHRNPVATQVDRVASGIEQLNQTHVRRTLNVPTDDQTHRALDTPRTVLARVTRALVHVRALLTRADIATPAFT